MVDGDAEGRSEGVVLLDEKGSCGDCTLAIGDGIRNGANCNKLRWLKSNVFCIRDTTSLSVGVVITCAAGS